MAVALAAIAASGCMSSPSPSASPPGFASAAVRPSASAAPASASRGPASGQPATVEVDPALLELLPGEVAGVALEFDAQASADAARASGVAASARSLAYAVAADAASGDIAIVTVAQPRESGFDEEAFRDWRDTYDGEACSSRGGVRGNATAVLEGRTVHIGTCEADGHTYHAWVEGSQTVISAFAIGPARIGERLMAEIREP